MQDGRTTRQPEQEQAQRDQRQAQQLAHGERAEQKSQLLVRLAELLDVSQQAITAYESGQRRVPISTLPLLARTLGVSMEDLIGVPATRSTGKRGPAPKLQQQLEQLSRLPKAQQKLVSQVIDSVLAQAAR